MSREAMRRSTASAPSSMRSSPSVNAAPSCVGVRPSLPRSNSLTPVLRSKPASRRLTVGWVVPRARAAALSEPWRATARAIFRSFQSMTEGVHDRFSIRPLYEIVWAGYENKGRAWSPDDPYQHRNATLPSPRGGRKALAQTTEKESEMTQNIRARDVNDL